MGLLLLRELNVQHIIHGNLINQLYSWLIAQKTLTPGDVEQHDQHLDHVLDRHCRRRDGYAFNMKEQLVTQRWGSGWYLAMGYKNVPGESWPDP